MNRTKLLITVGGLAVLVAAVFFFVGSSGEAAPAVGRATRPAPAPVEGSDAPTPGSTAARDSGAASTSTPRLSGDAAEQVEAPAEDEVTTGSDTGIKKASKPRQTIRKKGRRDSKPEESTEETQKKKETPPSHLDG